jgi:hypothetical protein
MDGGDPAFGPHRAPFSLIPIATDVALFREVLDAPAIGLATLLAKWLFGVHVLSPDHMDKSGA